MQVLNIYLIMQAVQYCPHRSVVDLHYHKNDFANEITRYVYIMNAVLRLIYVLIYAH